MTVNELVELVDEGNTIFIGQNNRPRIVITANEVWTQYKTLNAMGTIKVVTTKKFANWAKQEDVG